MYRQFCGFRRSQGSSLPEITGNRDWTAAIHDRNAPAFGLLEVKQK